MFVAMNRFVVDPARAGEFEEAWKTRESYLAGTPGFQAFALLKGETENEYISHSTWADRSAFEAWTRSENFRRGHAMKLAEGVLVGHPRVAFYEAILTEQGAEAVTA